MQNHDFVPGTKYLRMCDISKLRNTYAWFVLWGGGGPPPPRSYAPDGGVFDTTIIMG